MEIEGKDLGGVSAPCAVLLFPYPGPVPQWILLKAPSDLFCECQVEFIEEEPMRQCGLPPVSLAQRVHSILPFWSLPSRSPALPAVLPQVGLRHLSFFLQGRLRISCFLCNLRSPVDSHKVLNLKLILFFFCCKDGRNTFSWSLHLEAKVFVF